MNATCGRCTIYLPLLLFAVALAQPAPLHAQVVHGSLVADDTTRAVVGAIVQILNGSGERLNAVLSEDDGRFELVVEASESRLRLQVDAFGYERVTLALPRQTGRDRIDLGVIRLARAPIVLEEVRVEAEQSRLRSGREWVRRHQLHGTGTFLSGAIIARDSPNSLGMYVADRTKLWVRYDGRGSPTLLNPHAALTPCMAILINRWPIDRTGYRSIDDIPVDDVAAIEIYENNRDLPPGYHFEDGNRGCGVIQVWLWNSW